MSPAVETAGRLTSAAFPILCLVSPIAPAAMDVLIALKQGFDAILSDRLPSTGPTAAE